jgi:hypothetical protein
MWEACMTMFGECPWHKEHRWNEDKNAPYYDEEYGGVFEGFNDNGDTRTDSERLKDLLVDSGIPEEMIVSVNVDRGTLADGS